MAGAEWYYTQNNKRVGPVSLGELRAHAKGGGLGRDDMVWTVGMSQWTRAGTVSAVFDAPDGAPSAQALAATPEEPAPMPIQPAQASAPMPALSPVSPAEAAIGYYAIAGIPPRAAATLRGYAPPAGDTGDWPLDDTRVEQFAQTLKIRKKVTGAANLYRALLFLAVIVLVIFGVMLLGLTVGGPRARGAPALIATATATGILAGFAALYYFTWRATMRAHRWAPLTMFIIFLFTIATNALTLAIGAVTNTPGNLAAGGVGILFSIAFAAVSWQSFSAIPKYRAQPAWCQELIVKAGL